MQLSDAQVEEATRLINAAIHELVFVVQHLEQNDGDDALTCLTQVQQNCETVADLVVAAQKEAA